MTLKQVERLLLILVEVAAKWDLFLGQLEVPRHRLDRINRDTPHTDTHSIECLRAGLYAWVKSSKNATYGSLCNALRCSVIEEELLAERIERHISDLEGIRNIFHRGFNIHSYALNSHSSFGKRAGQL